MAGGDQIEAKVEGECQSESLGRVPKEWDIVTVEDLCSEIKSGFASGSRDDDGVIQLRMNNITPEGKIALDNYLKVPISKSIDDYLLEYRDVLFNNTNSVDLIGKTAIYKNELESCTFSNHITRIRVNENEAIPEWILYNFTRKWELGCFKRICQIHVGQAGIRNDDLKKMRILKPSLPEQKKIAEILSTVDESIEKTEAIIAQTEVLKRGLMQELFTRGIGHKEIKEKEIGTLPASWNVVPIKWYIKKMKSGLSRKILSYDIGLPVVTSNNIQNEKLDCSEFRYWYKDDPQGANTSEYILNEDNLLLNFINSIKQIGKCCIFKDIGRDAIYTTNIFRIEINPKRVSSQFLYYLINSQMVQKEIKSITKPAINQASFTKPDFESIKVPLVPLNEQQKIASILSSVDEKIEAEKKQLKQLKTFKRGLMQDLLTGRVRVAVSANA